MVWHIQLAALWCQNRCYLCMCCEAEKKVLSEYEGGASVYLQRFLQDSIRHSRNIKEVTVTVRPLMLWSFSLGARRTLVSCRVNCNCHYFYGSEVKSLKAQMLKLRAYFYVWQQVRQLLLFLPNVAPEVILECLNPKFFWGGGHAPRPPLVATVYGLTN